MEALPQIFIVLVVVAVTSIAAHLFIRRLVLASFVAGAVGGLAFVVVGYVQDGRVSVIPFAFGGTIALVVALIVGLVFHLVRRGLS